LKKALYGLKQDPRSWYSILDRYLHKQGFIRGNEDSNIYIKVDQGSMIIIEVYVDDIIFGSDDDRLSHNFSKDIHNEFEMSLLGELNFFLGLHISHIDEGIFISQTKYINEMLNNFKMEDCKPSSTPMVIDYKLRKDYESKESDQRLCRSMIGSIF
jgi:hypothetical protein